MKIGNSSKPTVTSDVWIPASGKNEHMVYELAKVLSIDDETRTCVVRIGSQREQVLPIENVQLTNPRIVADMTSLYHINDAGILHNLKVRSENDLPYTMMGSVLVSVNPLHPIADPILSTDTPHPYSIAENAFKNMTFCFERWQQRERQLGILQRSGHDIGQAAEIELVVNQSVVISGESGSGKTEAGKRVLHHLVRRSSKTEGSQNNLDTKLAGVGPILEGFGNASTVCNHNSSRFGKFSKLHFFQSSQERDRNKTWQLQGASVSTYLLEQSRVVKHCTGERNFHVFYQLIRGADTGLRKALGLQEDVSDFDYLTSTSPMGQTSASPEPIGSPPKITSGSTNSRRLRRLISKSTVTDPNGNVVDARVVQNDKHNFQELVEALGAIGQAKTDIDDLFKVVAGILHLGNIRFTKDESAKTSDAARLEDGARTQTAVAFAAKQLGVSEQNLLKLFLQREVKAGSEVIVTQLDAVSARYARDALAKWTYSRLFEFLVNEINTTLMSSDLVGDFVPFIGVLDIFGFESFAKNGFEQLLINYTNESLQSTFNYQVFVAEADLYKREGLILDGEPFVCPTDDGACLDLLEGKPGIAGLLMEIDSESRAPRPSDTKMNRRIHSCFSGKKSFPKPHPKELSSKFCINHYAGKVEYTVGDFVDKNNDRVPAAMNNIMANSSNMTLQRAFGQLVCSNQNRGKPAKKTVIAKFGGQIRQLVETLESTKCSFIRCVKPNALMKWARGTNWFDNRYVTEQLKCLSIPQTAAVLKSGLPTRISYETIVSAYESALPSDALAMWNRSSKMGRTFAKALFWAFRVPTEAYRLGLSRVFFTNGMIDLLDRIMREATSWAEDEGKSCDEKIEVSNRFKLYYTRLRWRRCFAKIIATNQFLNLLTDSRTRGHAVRSMQRSIRAMLFRNHIEGRVEKKRQLRLAAERKVRQREERRAFQQQQENMSHMSNIQQNPAAPQQCTKKLEITTDHTEEKERDTFRSPSPSRDIPPLHRSLSQSGFSARQAYRSGKKLSSGWSLSAMLHTPRGTNVHPQFLDIVDLAQKTLKTDNEVLREQNAKLQSDLEALKDDIALLKKSMP
eukprot:CAMPEP_0203760256 /NCGR_PEP_ID=MMETSP0098-20131031/13593_1 /ASSEMBLY_ACC=CAM_ASM_000208 /TAXON_ID=96639 /ORGANISM=" , Strain NY0313808BC1" /LENGTH=1078 /DNA_ID=CAMNT_0050653751 /DNA_START=1235 /DNA_END=4467 /DNA_ORIENTATION=-